MKLNTGLNKALVRNQLAILKGSGENIEAIHIFVVSGRAHGIALGPRGKRSALFRQA